MGHCGWLWLSHYKPWSKTLWTKKSVAALVIGVWHPETVNPPIQSQRKQEATFCVCVFTEAGKIALNYIRQDGLGDSSHEDAGLETVVGDGGQVSQKCGDGPA